MDAENDNIEQTLKAAAERREKAEFNIGEWLMETNRSFDRLFRNPPQNPQTHTDMGRKL